jgi:hypothetical protein
MHNMSAIGMLVHPAEATRLHASNSQHSAFISQLRSAAPTSLHLTKST